LAINFKGRPFFIHPRPGKNERIFNLIKFISSEIIVFEIQKLKKEIVITGNIVNTLFRLCVLLIKYEKRIEIINIAKKRVLKYEPIDFVFKYFHKRQFQRNLFYYKINSDEKKNIYNNYILSHLNKGNRNIFNVIIQFIEEFKTIMVNAVSSQVVDKLMNAINSITNLYKSARSFMFKSMGHPSSLRKLYFNQKNTHHFFDYFLAIKNTEEHYQNLYKLEKQTKNYKKKQRIKEKIKKIKMPHLFLVGDNAEYTSYKMTRIINFLLKKSIYNKDKAYSAYFDCLALKNGFRYLSTSPKGAESSFILILFSLLKQNIQLNRLFSDTRKKKYRLDILIFNDVLNLVRNRFSKYKLSIVDLLTTTMFLENIYEGHTFCYIFTVNQIKENELDYSIFKTFKHFIYLDNNYETKVKIIKTKKIIVKIYNNEVIKKNQLKIKTITKWCLGLIKNNENLLPEHLEMFFEQINMVLANQNLPLNEEMLNILAQTMKLI
jgi:hypothetical protein